MRHIFSISLLFTTLISLGVNSAPKILRACLNFEDSVVTVSWKPIVDQCGSFNSYSLYGSVNNGSFTRLATITDPSITEYPHQTVDADKTWRYYISVDFLCNGIPSPTSDTIAIDLTIPAQPSIDSVSYDLATQKIIAGWQPSVSADKRNYEILESIGGGTQGDSIGTTTQTFFVVSDAKTGRFPVLISTFDSCNLSSLNSNPHTPSFLNTTIDTCLREITLSWTRYSGWDNIDSQALFVSKDGIRFAKDTIISGNLDNIRFDKFILGDTIHFYLRSYTKNGTITSSSNIRTIETRKFVVPQYLYLSLATVFDDVSRYVATPSVSWQTDNIVDIQNFEISEGIDKSNMEVVRSIDKETETLEYWYDHITKNAKLSSYFFQINAMDKCGDTLITSNISRTIHLSINPKIVHNEYINWDVGVRDYSLTKHDGSTWNTLYTQPDVIENIDFSDSTGCYRVQAIEIINQYNSTTISYSNVFCIQKPLNFYVTTAINPTSANNRFIIKGDGIDHSRSYYQIFNRWGQQIARNATDIAWYANYNGQQVPPGAYIYIANLYGVLGESTISKGVINVIK